MVSRARPSCATSRPRAAIASRPVVAVVACGAEPNLDLVRNTPLSGPHGSPVTEYLETEEKGIYAIGDLAFYPDRMMGGVRRQTHWENAREQGLSPART